MWLAIATIALHVRAPLASVRCSANSAAELATLQATATAIESIWQIPITHEGERRALAAQETKESTHATLWGPSEWELHTRPDRYLSVVLLWPWSKLAQSLVPPLLPLAAWSWIVWRLQFKLTTTALGFLASPLGLLLAFRVNGVVARFHEARALWGQMIFSARNLASVLSASEPGEVPPPTRAECCRLLIAYAWCAKAAARADDDVRPLLETLLPPEAARHVASARKPPLAVLSLLRRATQQLPFRGTHVPRAVLSSIGELNRLHGGMERLLSTPLSPTYMRHTQRGLLLWLTMLPCGLLSAGCGSLKKLVLVVLVVAYIMLGIDAIGIQIEQPFEVLPLHSLAAGLTRDVADELLRTPIESEVSGV